MRRLIISFSVLFAVSWSAVPAHAEESHEFRPPFQRASGIGYLTVARGCGNDGHPASGLRSDPATGSVAAGEGLSVTQCAGISQGYEGSMRLGEMPARLLGRPGEIVLTLTLSRVEASGTGSADSWGALGWVGLRSEHFRRTHTVVSISCTKASCSRTVPRHPKRFTVRLRVGAIPSRLDVLFGADATLTRGSASFGAAYAGVVRMVTVRAA